MNADRDTSLAEFPLGWRFTTVRLGRPASEIVSRITPLSAARAAQVAREALRRTPGDDAHLRIIRSDDAPGSVRDQLSTSRVDPATEVMVSWNDRAAVVTDWATFVAHWDDFCYPASDDVVVWAADGDWTLRYHHYEVFQFWHHPVMERDRA